MSMTKKNQAQTLAQLQAMITGLQKHMPNGQFTFGGVAFTTASLVQLFQGLVTSLNAAASAHAAAKDAAAKVQTGIASVGPVFDALERNVQDALGVSSQTLVDFGMTPRKPRTPLTVEQKAAAKAKAEATRKARGTTSKKQKLAISGNVTGVTITPVTATPQPATAPAATATAPTTPGK